MTGIIILEYNNSYDTISCIESVLKFNTAPIKIIVVDNGSPNKEVINQLDSYFIKNHKSDYSRLESPEIKSPLSKFTFLVSDTNDGYASGNNKGLSLAYADSDIDTVMILNSDVLFVEDIVPNLLKDLLNPNVAIVSPVLYKKDMQGFDTNCARNQVSVRDMIWIHFPYPADPFNITSKRKIKLEENMGLIPIELPSGSCMIASKSLWKEIDGFDSGTFLYYEENILWEKIKCLGKKNYLDTNLKCIHLGATTIKTEPSFKMISADADSCIYFSKNYLKSSVVSLAILKLVLLLTKLRVRIINSRYK